MKSHWYIISPLNIKRIIFTIRFFFYLRSNEDKLLIKVLEREDLNEKINILLK